MSTCVGWPNGVVPSAARLFSKAFAYLVMKRQLCSFLCQAYRLCTEAYLANGRDGYGVLTKAKVIVSVSSIHRLYLVLTEFETGLFCSFFLIFLCVYHCLLAPASHLRLSQTNSVEKTILTVGRPLSHLKSSRFVFLFFSFFFFHTSTSIEKGRL